MSASKSFLEHAPEASVIQPFFHVGITFKDNKVTFSSEARAALEELIGELQSKFIEEPEDSAPTTTESTEVSASTVSKVIETMESEGKWKKALKFTNKFLLIIKKKGKGKKAEEAVAVVQKKIKKYVGNLQKFEVPVEYEDTEGKKLIEGLRMTIWPNSTVDSVIVAFNNFLIYQVQFKEKAKK
ncbi:hypothetical protein K2X92_02025 [Candidatus Gracilibacteria bacterium]|nr:hypothetical protein [Candidatus Gracilibacteria bacterium]